MKIYHAIAKPTIALGLLLLLSCSHEDESATSSYSKNKPDQSFFNMAAQGNLTEVEAGRLALMKSGNSDVRTFGQRIIKDHSKANGELSSLANKKSIPLPTKLDAAHQKEIDRLSGLSGNVFDQTFSEIMVTDHVKEISLFEEAAKGAGDPEVRNYAQSSIGMLEDHLQLARNLNEKLGAPRGD